MRSNIDENGIETFHPDLKPEETPQEKAAREWERDPNNQPAPTPRKNPSDPGPNR